MGAESGLRRRVKGLSEAEFRRAVRDRGAVPGGAVPAPLGQGLGLPGLRPRGLCRAQGPRGLPVQPLQAPGRVDRRDGVPLDQAAADHVVSGDLPSEPEQGRDELGRAGAAAGHPPADRVADEAQADGGDGRRATPASPSSQAGSRSTTPISAAQRPGGKRGRGAAGKTPFVAAVETTPERKPRRLRLTVVKGFRKKEIEELAKRDFAAGSNVVTDGLSCWTAVEQAGCSHFPMITGSGPQAAKWVPFTWVNTALGNIKTALAGTYHHISAKHAQRYLASYAWRFNRRFQLDTLTERLAYACARTAPHPYRVIIEG